MKWLHNILKGASLTGALFVFQACYGTPQTLLGEEGVAPMTFSVVSHETGEPLQGISIHSMTGISYSGTSEENLASANPIGTTGADGKCRVEIPYIRNLRGPVVIFSDPSGQLATKDTTLLDLQDRVITIKMDPQ